MAEGDEPQVAQLLLERVGDQDFRRALGHDSHAVGAKTVNRQSGNDASAVDRAADAANSGQPPRLVERVAEDGRECVRRVAPEVAAAVGAAGLFAKHETVHARSVVLIRFAHQDARQGQPHEPGVFRFPKRSPLEVIELLESPGQIEGALERLEILQFEHRRVRRGDERRKRRGRHLGDGRQNAHVVDRMGRAGPGVDLVVADQHAERHSTRRVEFLAVDFAEQLALVEFGGALHVARELFPGEVEHADLEVLDVVRLVDQVVQPAPGGFELLESLVVEDRVDLVRDQRVEPRDLAAETLRHLALGHPLPRRRRPGKPFFQGFGGRGRKERIQAVRGLAAAARSGGDRRLDQDRLARRRRRGAAAVAAGPIHLDRAG